MPKIKQINEGSGSRSIEVLRKEMEAESISGYFPVTSISVIEQDVLPKGVIPVTELLFEVGYFVYLPEYDENYFLRRRCYPPLYTEPGNENDTVMVYIPREGDNLYPHLLIPPSGQLNIGEETIELPQWSCTLDLTPDGKVCMAAMEGYRLLENQ